MAIQRVNATTPPIKVIVVGIGLAGLAAAIECHRKGHLVILLDRVPEVLPTNGDGIAISPNAARVIRQWGNGTVHERLQDFISDATNIANFSSAGEFLHDTPMEAFTPGNGYLIHRGTLVYEIYEHARSLGIDIRLGSPVTDYWETDKQAGVVVNGERIEADCVICAEGIRSRGRLIITGQEFEEEPDPTFFAFRGYIRMEELRQDPETSWIAAAAERGDVFQLWTDDGIHFSFFTSQQAEILVCYGARKLVTSKCSPSAQPILSHGSDSNIETAISWIQDWPVRAKLEPVLRRTATHGFFIQTRHAAQRPLKSWRSRLGRMMVIGDAAHPTPPASAQSGSQAIEDGAVLAIALEMAGKEDILTALEVAEQLRYHRATAVQVQGRSIQDAAFGKAVPAPPGRPEWIWDHDCQEHAYREYGHVTEAIRLGKQYVSTNCEK